MRPVPGARVLQTTTEVPVGPDELLDYWPTLVGAGWFLLGFGVTTLVGWYVLEPAVARSVRRRNRNNPTIQEAIRRYLRLLVVVIALFVGAGVAGYGGFVTDSAIVIAAATLALGVAGQAVIGSLISGLVLVMDPEFNVGNYIEWEDRAGVVQAITLRVTRVKTPNGELVTVPNTVLTSQAVTRPYGRGRYRVVDRIGIAYEDDLAEALSLLEAAARDVEGVLADPAPEVFVDEFGGDAVVVRVHYWIEDPRRRGVFAVRSRYAELAKSRLEAAGITISPASKRELSGRIGVEDGA